MTSQLHISNFESHSSSNEIHKNSEFFCLWCGETHFSELKNLWNIVFLWISLKKSRISNFEMWSRDVVFVSFSEKVTFMTNKLSSSTQAKYPLKVSFKRNMTRHVRKSTPVITLRKKSGTSNSSAETDECQSEDSGFIDLNMETELLAMANQYKLKITPPSPTKANKTQNKLWSRSTPVKKLPSSSHIGSKGYEKSKRMQWNNSALWRCYFEILVLIVYLKSRK